MTQKIKAAVCAALFLGGAVCVFSQDEMAQRGSIPEELLRPRREEAPRYPIDTVIGPLGQGQAPPEAYQLAKKIASALLAGNMNASVLDSVSKPLVESYMSVLNEINPRYFRLGSGREEPDGSFSFMVRFAGREQGITGELFVRLEERRPPPQPAAVEPVPAEPASAELDSAEPSSGENEGENANETNAEETDDSGEQSVIPAEQMPEEQAPPVPDVPVERVWLFEDLILEEARSRDVENREGRHQFDFSPYERIF